MRISVNKDDSGYVADSYKYEVYLDGEKLINCFTADEELGEAHCYTGKFDHIKNSCDTEILKGKVKLIKTELLPL